MSQRRVSVVMPAYNAERFVAEAIESVLAQTHQDLELIVVDDGSTDRTAAVVASFGARVRCVRQQNARQAAARNRGVREATGDYLAFIDADDLWRPEKLAKQLRVLEADPSLGFVYCNVDHVDEDGRFVCPRPGAVKGRALEPILMGEPIGGLCGSTLLISRARFAEIGPFDVDLPPCEDTDFWVRVAARYPLDYVDEALVRHRLHGGNDSRKLDLMTRAWKRLYRKSLQHSEVKALGLAFRLRCYSRLYYMLSGNHAQGRRWSSAVSYGALAVLAWPGTLWPLARKLAHRTPASASTGSP